MSTILPAVTSLFQFGARRSAGKLAEGEAKIAAQQEELGAIQREADRKGRLATALASQTASAGARGIAQFEGSPLSVLEEDIRREEEATQRDIFQTKLAVLTGKARGKIARKQAQFGATVGLISDVGKLATLAPGGAGKPAPIVDAKGIK